MALVKFKALTATEFSAISTKDENTLYFITDTYELYKGSVEYCRQDSYTPETGTMVFRTDCFIITSATRTAISLPTSYSKGHAWRVTGTSGYSATLGSYTIEPGDLVVAIANMDSSPATSDFAVFKNGLNIHETEWEG